MGYYIQGIVKSAGDTYEDTLRGSNFNNEFIDLLSTRDICDTIKNYITSEQIKCAISYDVLKY
ncbi:hypothetical protein PFDG_04526 [Plasmodium falciparum Dd2]|uniref:Uncharacterized protein n=1 Tax=Plasmodium falciparum (isolate Dd2) TaxID=57267 RepID=A0A0L7M592_PLAF4|nr:hypothetical protein PFDG_04526 [Plasmodium falciparum Dd2]